MSRATLLAHQAACRACHQCVDDGIIPEANPTFAGQWGAPFMLVGQAPGPDRARVAAALLRPRRQGARPLDAARRLRERRGVPQAHLHRRAHALLSRAQRRRHRRSPAAAGRQSPTARTGSTPSCACSSRRSLIPVGQMAINRFLGPGSLEGRVGKRFGERPVMVPLPHPSGTSRWLNDPANRDRLAVALELIADLRLRHAPAPKKISSPARATGSLTGHPARPTQRLIDKERKA